jgi:ATP-dependent helicase/nuclease subunit A
MPDSMLPCSEAIAASAGTGKTFSLALRYIRLLAAGVAPQRIIALTFSRSAAAEIFDRIVRLMLEWIEDPGRLQREGAALGMPAMAAPQLTRLLRGLIDSQHRVQVGTLDSFLVRVVRLFPFEFGLAADFAIIDDRSIDKVRTTVLRRILQAQARSAGAAAFLQEFKLATFGGEEKGLSRLLGRFVADYHADYLQTAACGIWGDAADIWPAGSAMLAPAVDPKIEADAVRAALDRYPDMCKRHIWEEFLTEAESFGPHSRFVNRQSFFEEKLLAALPELAQGRCAIPGYTRGKDALQFSADECRHLVALIRYLAGCCLAKTLRRSAGLYQVLKRYDELYDRLVRRAGMLTFDDIHHIASPLSATLAGRRLSGQGNDDARLYIDYRLDARFDHWLLDEFQDTGFEQWAAIRNLIDEIMQDRSGGRSFFYVGDVKQAIYGWRNGDARLFHAVAQECAARYGGFRVRSLTRSYRSCPEVIATVNRVFDGLMAGRVNGIGADFIAAWSWEPHSTALTQAAGYAGLVTMPKADRHSLLERTAQFVRQTVAAIRPFERGLSVAVLVRTNTIGAELFERLKALAVPAALEGAVAITDCDVVRALIALVKYTAHPGDTVAAEHVAMSPLAALVEKSSAGVAVLLEDVQAHGFARFIQRWAGRLESEAGVEFSAFSRMRISDLVRAGQQFDGEGGTDCSEFIDFVKAYRKPAGGQPGVVQIMTVHKAKGLEWDIVFTTVMKGQAGITRPLHDDLCVKRGRDRAPQWATLLPPRAVAAQDETLGAFIRELDGASFYDELCILYVALTRAKMALYMLIESKGRCAESVQLSDILAETLGGGDAGAIVPQLDGRYLYQDGNAAWYEAIPIETGQLRPADEHGKIAIGFGDVLRTMSPSGAEARKIDCGRLLAGQDRVAKELGIAVHELLALVEDAGSPDPSTLADRWRRSAAFSEGIGREACALFTTSLMSPEVRLAMTRPALPGEVWRERAFEVIIDDRLVSGILDRVAIVRDADGHLVKVDLLDFKTDRVEDESGLARAIAIYRPQMDLYQSVVSRLLDVPAGKIAKKLLFIRPGRVIELD